MPELEMLHIQEGKAELAPGAAAAPVLQQSASGGNLINFLKGVKL